MGETSALRLRCCLILPQFPDLQLGLLHLDSRNVYLESSLDTLPWIQHGFGTRLTSGWPDPATTTTMKQVHSDRILEAKHPGLAGEGDALITNRPGLLLSIRTADCLPILVADRRNHVVGAIHAGWRGTVAEISPKTVRAMMDRFGSRPDDLSIVIGPSIGQCCFEVGADVAAQFQKYFPERADLSKRTQIDLLEANRRQLRQLGVPDAQIVSSGLCTCCRQDTFHSYRRDRDAAGRMVSGISIRG